MNGKRWMLMVLSALTLVFVVWGGLNWTVDPFNAFGDKLFGWDSYTQTLNPRNSKIKYISENFDRYDSYIIGSSSASSYLPETLNTYLDAQFYNMFHYGADTAYDKKIVSYLLKNDDVKHIFLVLGLNEANKADFDNSKPTDSTHPYISGESDFSYYKKFLFASPSFAFEKITSKFKDTFLPQPFDVFVPKYGTYDKRVRDVEPIGSLAQYIEKNGSAFPSEGKDRTLTYIDGCVQDVLEIRKMCEESGAELTVVLTPICKDQLNSYTNETLDEFFTKLGTACNYWNFAISDITYDQRYFYDTTHTRNSTGNMVIAHIFDEPHIYRPDDFGILCNSKTTVSASERKNRFKGKNTEESTVTVPVLQYSDFSKADSFDRHMKLLKENGYTTVTFDQLTDFVNTGTPLPSKPVIISFNGGYRSNYDYAFPILKQYNMNSTIFITGNSVENKESYIGSEEIREMVDSGLVSVESRSYGINSHISSDPPALKYAVPLEAEEDADFIKEFTKDINNQKRIFKELGLNAPTVFTYPNGIPAVLSDVILKNSGYNVTLTSDETKVNTIVPGLPQSLVNMGSLTVKSDTTDEDILNYLKKR